MNTIDGRMLDSQITQPWNKGKLTGAKPALRPKHVWSVRTRLQLANRLRPHEDREHGRYLGIEVDDALAVAEQIDV